MHKYGLEFILSAQGASLEDLKNSLSACGEGLEIFLMPQSGAERGNNFKIQISTLDPTIIFDTCSQFGRLKSIKIEDR